MNKFEELETFVSVVDHLSFSAASERSGVAKSVLSRRVSELEKRLGVQLMQRTTRKLLLTDTGEHFYQRALGIGQLSLPFAQFMCEHAESRVS